jgi:hypothetical protein
VKGVLGQSFPNATRTHGTCSDDVIGHFHLIFHQLDSPRLNDIQSQTCHSTLPTDVSARYGRDLPFWGAPQRRSRNDMRHDKLPFYIIPRPVMELYKYPVAAFVDHNTALFD